MPQQNDHDLLIAVKTTLDLLVGQFSTLQNGLNSKVEALGREKLDIKEFDRYRDLHIKELQDVNTRIQDSLSKIIKTDEDEIKKEDEKFEKIEAKIDFLQKVCWSAIGGFAVLEFILRVAK